MNHKIDHKCERNVATIDQVGTISAYPSLSEGGFGQTLERMWARSSKLALSRLTFHYTKMDLGTQLCKVDILQSGIGPILAKVCLIEGGFGPKLSKVGTALSGVDLVQNLAKWTLSGSQTEQSGHYRGQI